MKTLALFCAVTPLFCALLFASFVAEGYKKKCEAMERRPTVEKTVEGIESAGFSNICLVVIADKGGVGFAGMIATNRTIFLGPGVIVTNEMHGMEMPVSRSL